MAQKNRTNMLSDIVTNIYTNVINFITGNNAQQRFVNLLDSSPNILSDKDQANGYVGTSAANEMIAGYYRESITAVDLFNKADTAILVINKQYLVTNANGGTKKVIVTAATINTVYETAIELANGEIGTYDINTGTFSATTGSGNASITPITVAALNALRLASNISTTTFYNVTNAVGSTLVLQCYAIANNTNTPYAVNVATGEIGTYDIAGDTFTPSFVESISLQDNGTSIAATTYTIELYANYAYTINELKIIADAGTCTANLKINSTSVTSISAVSVSSTIATATASGANTVAVGDKITLVTTSNSGLNNLQLTIKTTRI